MKRFLLDYITVDLLGLAKLGLAITALIATYGTPIFWFVLWLVIERNVKLIARFRR
jgi:hypothetical protein